MFLNDFDDSGIRAAVRRLLQQAFQSFAAEARRARVATVPTKVLESSFHELCQTLSVRDLNEYSRRLCKLTSFVRFSSRNDFEAIARSVDEAELSIDGVPIGPQGRSKQAAACYCRLALGALAEAFAARKAHQACEPSALPCDPTRQAAFAALCHDAYLAAIWTDAHAVYFKHHAVLDEALRARHRGEVGVAELEPLASAWGQPHVRGTTCVSACPNVSDHLDQVLHGWTPKNCNVRDFISMLTKTNQSGNRGWEAIVKSICKSHASKLACTKIFLSSCVGMHPNLHPAARPRWDERLLLLATLKPVVEGSLQRVFDGCHVAMKESIRVYLAALMDDIAATKEALLVSGSPLGVFSSSPRALANSSVHAAAQMCIAGARAAAREIAALRPSRAALAPAVVCAAMQSAFADTKPPKLALAGARDPRASEPRSSSRGAAEAKAVSYASSWASKIAFFSRPKKVDRGVNAMDLASEMLVRCFKTEFVPFWIHGHAHEARVGRLDASQRRSLHGDACGRRLTEFLSDVDVLRLVRMVWRCRVERFLTADEVFEKLGLDEESCERLQSKSNFDDAIEVVLELDAMLVAKFLTFGKLASIKHKFFAYDLGDATKRLQLAALRRRFKIEAAVPDDEVIANLPDHAVKLHYCVECNKISNACVTTLAKPQLHDELGVAQTMLRVGAVDEVEHVRCAKRSSAAYRTAIAKEESAKRLRVEMKDTTMESLERGFVGNGDSSHLQRLRRDLFTCATQLDSATGCGDSPVVLVPIFGKAIRVAGKWLTICSVCGSITRVDPARRYGGHVCCRRCDPAMLGSTRPGPTRPRPGLFDRLEVERNCRFCGKKPPMQAVSKFVLYRTPSDESGRNGAVPKPLRCAFFCASHSRPWMTNALRDELDMRIVFAHILNRAVPVWGANASSQQESDELAAAAENAKKRRQTLDRRFKRFKKIASSASASRQ